MGVGRPSFFSDFVVEFLQGRLPRALAKKEAASPASAPAGQKESAEKTAELRDARMQGQRELFCPGVFFVKNSTGRPLDLLDLSRVSMADFEGDRTLWY